MFLSFNDDGQAVTSEVRGDFELPPGASSLALRYASTVDGYHDTYPGKTDAEVLAIIQARQAVLTAEMTFEQRKTAMLKTVRDHFDNMITAYKKDFASYEPDTWPIQQQELSTYRTDPTAPTPYVDSLAAGRQMTREALFEKIAVRVQGFAFVQGQQQLLEQMVQNAADDAALVIVLSHMQ